MPFKFTKIEQLREAIHNWIAEASAHKQINEALHQSRNEITLAALKTLQTGCVHTPAWAKELLRLYE